MLETFMEISEHYRSSTQLTSQLIAYCSIVLESMLPNDSCAGTINNENRPSARFLDYVFL